mgnify:CR=1 FL=1
MKLLAVDTSGPVCGVAILTEDGIRHECAVMNHKTHSVNLLPMIENAFQSTGLTIQDMDRLAVVVGPGSFTSVRLGVSTVKGLAHGAGKPCVAVNALEAMAAGISGFSGVVCPIQDARVQQVYGAAFCSGKRLLDDCVLKLSEYLDKISPLGERFLFTGDGVAVYRQQIADCLGDRVRFAAAPCAYLRPAAVAALAARDADKAVDYLTLQPLYLRAPQAERERAAREARQHG